MTDITTELPKFHLNPGRVIFSQSPMMISTILGSCVSVVMHHSRTGMGAMCHGLLPTCRCGGEYRHKQVCDDCFRYMDCSIRYMIEEFGTLKIPVKELTIKLFGGADMFSTGQTKTVGHQNIHVARDLLRTKNLRIASEDVGGDQGRKIFFFTHTGEVRLKRLGKNREHYKEFQEELAAIKQAS